MMPESGQNIIITIVIKTVFVQESCEVGVRLREVFREPCKVLRSANFLMNWPRMCIISGGNNAIPGAQAKLIPSVPHTGWEYESKSLHTVLV